MFVANSNDLDKEADEDYILAESRPSVLNYMDSSGDVQRLGGQQSHFDEETSRQQRHHDGNDNTACCDDTVVSARTKNVQTKLQVLNFVEEEEEKLAKETAAAAADRTSLLRAESELNAGLGLSSSDQTKKTKKNKTTQKKGRPSGYRRSSTKDANLDVLLAEQREQESTLEPDSHHGENKNPKKKKPKKKHTFQKSKNSEKSRNPDSLRSSTSSTRSPRPGRDTKFNMEMPSTSATVVSSLSTSSHHDSSHRYSAARIARQRRHLIDNGDCAASIVSMDGIPGSFAVTGPNIGRATARAAAAAAATAYDGSSSFFSATTSTTNSIGNHNRSSPIPAMVNLGPDYEQLPVALPAELVEEQPDDSNNNNNYSSQAPLSNNSVLVKATSAKSLFFSDVIAQRIACLAVVIIVILALCAGIGFGFAFGGKKANSNDSNNLIITSGPIATPTTLQPFPTPTYVTSPVSSPAMDATDTGPPPTSRPRHTQSPISSGQPAMTCLCHLYTQDFYIDNEQSVLWPIEKHYVFEQVYTDITEFFYPQGQAAGQEEGEIYGVEAAVRLDAQNDVRGDFDGNGLPSPPLSQVYFQLRYCTSDDRVPSGSEMDFLTIYHEAFISWMERQENREVVIVMLEEGLQQHVGLDATVPRVLPEPCHFL